MNDLREWARRELERLQPSSNGLERTLRVVHRRRRNRRMAAGSLGLLLAAALVAGLLALAQPARRPAAVTPTGSIAFSRGGPEGGIYVMNPDGTGLTRLLTSEPGDAQPAWSPDGSEVAFVRFQDGNEDIYVVRLVAEHRAELRGLTSHGASSSPAWSPDGTRIAFARQCCGDADIYVMDSDGTHKVNLTNDSLIEFTPAWSPDGSKIAFAGYSKGPPPSPVRLYVMNADRSGMRRIGPDEVAWPAWSPDAGRIAFIDTDSRTLDVIDADGTELREVVHLGDLGESASNLTTRPTWSPDGTKLAFSAGSEASSTHIYVVNTDGTGLEPLTSGAYPDQDPAWSAPLGPRPSSGRANAAVLMNPRSGTVLGFAPMQRDLEATCRSLVTDTLGRSMSRRGRLGPVIVLEPGDGRLLLSARSRADATTLCDALPAAVARPGGFSTSPLAP